MRIKKEKQKLQATERESVIALVFLVDITNQRDLKALLEIRINLNVKLSMCANFNLIFQLYLMILLILWKGIIFKFSVKGALLAQWLLRDLVLQSLNQTLPGPREEINHSGISWDTRSSGKSSSSSILGLLDLCSIHCQPDKASWVFVCNPQTA